MKRTTYEPIRYTWSPDLDLNSPRPCNPDRLTRADVRRHRLLLEMLAQQGSWYEAYRIVVGHPYLRAQYDELRMQQRCLGGET
jgi:hypothetical protein